MTQKKCGYVALVGAPNAGKSTLLNAILKKKISIVSNKPQTTRSRILGIAMQDSSQILFLDTPGLGDKSKALSQYVWDACQDADVICYMIDATRGFRTDDITSLTKLSSAYKKKILVVGTKTDKLKKQLVLKATEEFKAHLEKINSEHMTLFMGSAKKPEDLSSLTKLLAMQMPESEWLYDENARTDSSENFICAEYVREQLFRQLGEELPYQVSVVVEHFEVKPHIIDICVIIKVARESQKAIVIGQGGARLKSIGQEARVNLENYLGKKIFLKIFVKKGVV